MQLIPTPKPARGFTLLEVMIALVIFSIGLLGLAGLQARGLQSNTTAQYRTTAMILAYDMADRIRANSTGVAAGNYDDLDNA
ncbi:MAG TPA: type IV pilus modification protein PilV, partial [Chromatiales bacterium]|nr:type IV pilus modification protein PilV [Chromatiales bacterium]